MVAVEHDIEVEQGATFEFAVECLEEDGQTPRTFSGYTGALQIRAERAPDATLLATATVTVATGLVTATIADDLTAAMDWRAGVYDLKITNGSLSERIARGNARFTSQVTT